MAKKVKRNSSGANKQIKKLQGVSTSELGGSGVNRYQGFYNEDYKSELKWPESLKVYEKMMKGDAQVKASIRVCQLPILAANWFITDKNHEDPRVVEAAEFLEKNLFHHKINFEQFLFEALGMLPMGFSLFEIVFELHEGQIFWGKLAWRKQYSIKRWQMSDGQPGVVQQLTDSFKRVDIPEWKLLLFTNEQEGDSQIGVSILRSAYKHWYAKDNLYKIDLIASERNGVGVLKITLPSGYNPEDKEAAAELGANFYANEQEYIILPNSDWQAEIMSGGSNLKDLDPSIKHHNREITKNVLAQFLELGTESSGSRALSEDHSSLLYLSLESRAKVIATNVSKKLKELLKMNGWTDLEKYPELDFSHIGIQDVSGMSTALTSFINAGLIQADDELEGYIRKVMQLPEKQVEVDEEGNPIKPNRKNKVQDTEGAKQALIDMLNPDGKKDEEEPKKKGGKEVDPKEEIKKEKEVKKASEASTFNEGDIFISEEHRKKISEGLKRYWAGIKQAAAKEALSKEKQEQLPQIPKQKKLPKLPSSITSPTSGAEAKKSIEVAQKQGSEIIEHMGKVIDAMVKIVDLLADTNLEEAVKTIKSVINLAKQNKEQLQKNLAEAAKELEKKDEEASTEKAESIWGMINNINEHNQRIEDTIEELGFNEPIYVDDSIAEDSVFRELHLAMGGIQNAGTFNEFSPDRDFYESEKKVQFKKFNEFFNEAEAEFGKDSKEILDTMIEGVLARGEKALDSGKLKEIGMLSLAGVSSYKALVKSNYKKSYDFGKNQAADELDILAPKTPAKRITQMNVTAEALVDRQMADLQLVAKTTLLDGVARNLSTKETMFNAKIALNKKAEILNRANVGISVIGQVTQARQDVFQDNIDQIELFQYSAILDSGTTKWCASLDGRVVQADSPEFEAYRPGQHYRCRSIWVAIGKEEKYKPKAEPIGGSIPKQEGGPGNFKDLNGVKNYTPKVD